MALQCSGDGSQPPKNRVGLSFGAFQTRLALGDFGIVPLDEAAVGASFERRISSKVTLQLNAGGILLGHLFNASPAFQGGFIGGGASFNVVDQKGMIPFLMLGASISVSVAGYPGGNNSRLIAGDIRGSVTTGYSDGRWTPYLVGRVFGGPVILTQPSGTSLGTDLYHFQLGLGLVVSLPKGFDLSLELVPLGEQRVSAGVGYSY